MLENRRQIIVKRPGFTESYIDGIAAEIGGNLVITTLSSPTTELSRTIIPLEHIDSWSNEPFEPLSWRRKERA